MPQHASPSHAFACHPGFVTCVVRLAHAQSGRRLTHRTLSEESFSLISRTRGSAAGRAPTASFDLVTSSHDGVTALSAQPRTRTPAQPQRHSSCPAAAHVNAAAAHTATLGRGAAARRSQSTGTRRSTAVSTIGARADASHCRRRSSPEKQRALSLQLPTPHAAAPSRFGNAATDDGAMSPR